MDIKFPYTHTSTITDGADWTRSAKGWSRETALFHLTRAMVQEDDFTDQQIDELLLKYGVSFEEFDPEPKTVLDIAIQLQIEENDKYGTCAPEEAGSLGFDFQKWINNHLDVELGPQTESKVIALITLQNTLQDRIDEIL